MSKIVIINNDIYFFTGENYKRKPHNKCFYQSGNYFKCRNIFYNFFFQNRTVSFLNIKYLLFYALEKQQ